MQRHYYISEDLDDLEQVSQQLIDHKIAQSHFHVLSKADADVENHHLHQVPSVLKKDIVHSSEIGAVIGLVTASLVLVMANYLSLNDTAAGWIPFIFLSIIVLGFCTWEGGLIGIHRVNHQFVQFEPVLKSGKHIFFIDVEQQQEPVLAQVIANHPQLEQTCLGKSAPSWLIKTKDNYDAFMRYMP